MQYPNEIFDWVQEQLGENTDYHFELCDRSLTILQSLMNKNRVQDSDALVRIEDLKQKTQEYRMESLSMKITLTPAGLTLNKLPESSMKYLNILSKTAKLLKLSQPSDTNYLLGLIQLRERMEACKRLQFEMKLEIAKLESNRSSLETLELQLQNLSLDPIFIRTNSERYLRSLWHEEKLNSGQVLKNMKQLKDTGARSSVSHQIIVAKKQKLDWIIQQCVAVRVKLEMFRNIPPSLSETEAAVKQMEDISQKLERHLACCIDNSVL